MATHKTRLQPSRGPESTEHTDRTQRAACVATDNTLHILFIAPAPRAGTLQYTHNLADALARRGHRVTVATGIGFELHAYRKAYEVHEVFDGLRPRPWRLLGFFWRYVAHAPHIVHFQGAQSPLIYVILWALLRLIGSATFVYTPQDVLPNTTRRYHRTALRFLYTKMRHVYLNAKQNESLVVEHFHVPPHRITVLPIADLTAFVRDSGECTPPDLPPDRTVVLCFGLIEPRKGIDTLLAAVPDIIRQKPNALILIVGKPLMDVTPHQRLIAEQHLHDHVHLRPGYVDFGEMAGYFAAAHMLVLPYESGWNSGVLASAFGFGKPVVATRVGGFDEVIVDGDTGLLVPPRDPASLAHAIVRMLHDKPLYAHMIQRVRETATAISWDAIAERTERSYMNVTESLSGAVSQTR
ncbi:MAG: glycosyltransferase family 4 protein [Nitrospiraceae bacterium]